MEKNKVFIKRVLELLDERKMTQKQLAHLSEIAESSVSRYLAGEMEPRMDIVVNIAKALSVPTAYLLGESELDLVKNTFQETYQMVARNKTKLSDEQKTQIVKLLFGQ